MNHPIFLIFFRFFRFFSKSLQNTQFDFFLLSNIMADNLPWTDEQAAKDAILAVRKDSDPTDWYGTDFDFFFCVRFLCIYFVISRQFCLASIILRFSFFSFLMFACL